MQQVLNIFVSIIGIIAFLTTFGSERSLRYRWVLAYFLLFSAIAMDHIYIVSTKVLFKVHLSDVLLVSSVFVSSRLLRDEGKKILDLPLAKTILLLPIFHVLVLILTYMRIGDQPSISNYVRLNAFYFGFFLFFAAMTLRQTDFTRMLDLLQLVFFLLLLYTALAIVFTRSEATGQAYDPDVEGWGRYGVGTLLPLACYMPLLFVLRTLSPRRRLFYSILFIAGALLIVLSMTRSNIFALGISFFFYFLLVARSRVRIQKTKVWSRISFAVFLIAIIVGGVNEASKYYGVSSGYVELLQQRIESTSEETGLTSSEQTSWRELELLQVPSMLSENPVWGMGYDNTFQDNLEEARILAAGGRASESRSERVIHFGFVGLLLSGGVVGLVLFYMVPIRILTRLAVPFKVNSLSGLSAACYAGVMTYFILTIFTSEFLFENGAIQFACFTGIISSVISDPEIGTQVIE